MSGNLSDFFEANKHYIFIGSIVISLLVLGYIVYSYIKTSKAIAERPDNTAQHVPHEFCSRDGTCYSQVPTVDEQARVEQFVNDDSDPENDTAEPIDSYTDAKQDSSDE